MSKDEYIELRWRFVPGEPVLESTLNRITAVGGETPVYKFTRSGNGQTMIFKLEGDMENYIGNIRWAPTIGMSMLNLRATRAGFGTVGGTSNTGGVTLKSLRKDVDDVIDAREFSINNRTFFWHRANEQLQDMVCWYRDTSYVQPRLAAHYLEDTGTLRIYRHGQEANREINDIIPITCVLNLHFRNLSMW